MEPQRVFEATWAFSNLKEAAYGTAIADASLNKRAVGEFIAATISKTWRSDMERAFKGDEFPTSLIEVTRDLRRGANFEFTTLIGGWIVAFGMGKVVTTALGGVPAAYEHVFTFPAITAAGEHNPPTTTVWEKAAGGLGKKLLAMACNDFAIRGAGQGVIEIVSNWIGSGQHTDLDISVPAVTAAEFLLNANSDILIGAEGAPVSIKDRIVGWEIGISQNLQEELGYHPGSGKYRGRIFRGARRPRAQLRVLAKDTDDLQTLFLNDTARELKIVNEGAVISGTNKHKLEIRLPNLRFSAAELGEEAGDVAWQLTAEENAVMKGAVLTEPIQILVVNDQASYFV